MNISELRVVRFVALCSIRRSIMFHQVETDPRAVQVCSADDRNVAWRKALAQTLGAQLRRNLLTNNSLLDSL